MSTHPATLRAQAATLATATRKGTHWTEAELEAIRTTTAPLAEVAKQFGRTLYAVTSARSVTHERTERSVATHTTHAPLPYDRGFTADELSEMFLGD